MKKLLPLFAATALFLSGGVLADVGDNNGSQSPGDSQASPEVKKPEGFVLIQRNIYVPVDAEGKVASNQWVVIDKQGFITAEELEAATREANVQGENGDMKDQEQQPGEETAPKPQEPAKAPSTSPSVNDHPAIGEGPVRSS